MGKTESEERSEKKLSKLESPLGFPLSDLTSWNSFVQLLFRPADASSIAVVRILFGAIMLLDIIEERGLGEADIRWGEPDECRFPLFNWMQPFPLEWMCMLYALMWMGALGMMLGAYFRISCLAFAIPYWYIFLLDKTSWNNHSYLYGLLSIIFLFSDAHQYWSLDLWMGRIKKKGEVPLWNYTVLRFQLFMLYFVAGLKKTDLDWLQGYSMTNLANHWVFHPLKYILTVDQIDLWVIHFFGFFLDLTIGFWVLFETTRPIALLFLASFHLMNAQIFIIGMFPYVCLATMPIFCNVDWPKNLMKRLGITDNVKNDSNEVKNIANTEVPIQPGKWKSNTIGIVLVIHAVLQAFLPYSHFVTKGYNNWTNGLYGYSWDMMVHTWDTVLVMVKVVDNSSGKEFYLDPEAWVRTNRWCKHADMVAQYAQCVNKNIQRTQLEMQNLSIYIDVWTSLNGRFQQRMFDPRVDMIQIEWDPFEKVQWVMPLLNQLSSWRIKMRDIQKEVYSWSNHSDAMFVADFPGLFLENYIHRDLANVSLTLLEGEVILEVEKKGNKTLHPGQSTSVPPETFHKIHTVSATPACYMYTFTNKTQEKLGCPDGECNEKSQYKSFSYYAQQRVDNIIRAIALVSNSVLKILYSVPMVRRVKIRN